METNEQELTAKRSVLMQGLKALGMEQAAIDEAMNAYDELLEGIIDEQTDHEVGAPEIEVLNRCATALNDITHDHLRRRVHKALGVLMLEPTPSPLEQLAEALLEMVRMLGPILAQGTGPVVEGMPEEAARREQEARQRVLGQIVRGDPGHVWLVDVSGNARELNADTVEKLGFPLA